MAGEWPTLTVAECASSEPYATQIGPFGDKIRAENYTATGAPVLRETNVNPDGRFHDDDFVFIDAKLAEAEFGKFVCEADDVILCHKGTLGKIGVIPKKSRFKKYIMGNSMMKVRCDRSKLEPLYLYYWLCSRDGQDYIFSRVSQVGVPQIQRPLSTLREASFPVPPLAEQKAIAAVLGALDDKIELNRRMNATLESMARALFQSWFIDFDPVRAKLDGRQPVGLDSATAAEFPAHFDHNAEGVVPTGWRATTLSEVIEISDSKRIPLSGREREARQGKYPYHGAASVMDYVDDFLFDGIYALMGEDGSVSNEDGTPVLQYVWGKFWVNNHAHVLRGKNGISTEHLLLHLKGCNIAPFVNGAVQPKLNQGNMNRIPFMLPPPEIGQAFAKTIEPLFAQMRANTDQSRTLATLRDTLLPKLLSGELSVAEDNCKGN
jgi:type I restriction enzyme S subunit